jgi:hypothetical protein
LAGLKPAQSKREKPFSSALFSKFGDLNEQPRYKRTGYPNKTLFKKTWQATGNKTHWWNL